MPTDKGQIISKGIFDIPEFSQKRFVVVVKTNSFIRFWGEFEDTKSPLDIIWPLVQKICRQGGGGVRKPEKNADVVYGWSIYDNWSVTNECKAL